MTDLSEMAATAEQIAARAEREQVVGGTPDILTPRQGCITFFKDDDTDTVQLATDVREYNAKGEWVAGALREAIERAGTLGFKLRDLNLRRFNMQNRDFRDFDFSDCDLRYTSWSGADIRSAIFRNAKLEGSTFGRAIAQHADFQYADLTDTCFEGVAASIMQGVDIWGTLDGGYCLWTHLKWGEEGTPERKLPPLVIIRAGCRKFTLAEANHHWTKMSERPAIKLALAVIAEMAEQRGWRTKLTEDEESLDPDTDEPGDEG